MTYSGNACCGAKCNYQVGLARAEKLQGPWEKFAGNPVLISSDAWKCPGHGTVVTTPDNRYFYLHHAYDGNNFTFTGRQGVLSELGWNEKTQWPTFRYGTTTPARAESPGGRAQKNDDNVSVVFANKSNKLPWVWDVSQPEPTFSVQNGLLQVVNTASGPTGSFLGLVVKNGTYTLSVDISPQANSLQSICLYGDASNALGFGVRGDSLELWQVKDGVRTVLKRQRITAKVPAIKLQLHSRLGRFYEFGWLPTNGTYQAMTEAPLDGSFLPRWDRAPRVGVAISGRKEASSRIQAIALIYK